MNLEVHGTFTDTNQRRTAIFNTLQVLAVACYARGLVQVFAFGDQSLIVLIGGCDLSIRGKGVGQQASAGQCQDKGQRTSEDAPHLAAGFDLLRRGHCRSSVLGGLWVGFHHFPFIFGESDQKGLLNEVDGGKQADPDNVNKVPVV